MRADEASKLRGLGVLKVFEALPWAQGAPLRPAKEMSTTRSHDGPTGPTLTIHSHCTSFTTRHVDLYWTSNHTASSHLGIHKMSASARSRRRAGLGWVSDSRLGPG